MSHGRLPRAGFAKECDRSAVQQLLESHLRVVRETDVSELVRGYAVPFLVGPETPLDVKGRSEASYRRCDVFIEFVSRHVFLTAPSGDDRHRAPMPRRLPRPAPLVTGLPWRDRRVPAP